MKEENKKKIIKALEKVLDLEYNEKQLLIRAFTHRSYLNEDEDVEKHNERLEFLGDAVLEFLVTKYLFKHYPRRKEGDLTSFRSAIVRTDSLAAKSRELGFGKYLRMSRGEEQTGGRDKDYLLANTFEALLGSMYLDQGMKACEQFLQRTLYPEVENIVKNRLDIDAKTKFQEIAQDLFKITPTYELVSEIGPDHDKTFEMSVYVGDKEWGKGKGSSKQKAEEAAAKKALNKIKNSKNY